MHFRGDFAGDHSRNDNDAFGVSDVDIARQNRDPSECKWDDDVWWKVNRRESVGMLRASARRQRDLHDLCSIAKRTVCDDAFSAEFLDASGHDVAQRAGAVDRSVTLWTIAKELAKSGATVPAAMADQGWQVYLFGPTPGQWRLASADEFMSQAIRFWNEWP
jgi:hypothetical protein